MGTRISKQQKVKFLQQNLSLAKRVFSSVYSPVADAEMITKIRKKFFYSPKTLSGDIMYGFLRAWKTINE